MIAGRLLGIDFGTVRIGLSICDPDKIVVSPLAQLNRQSQEKDLIHIRKLIAEEKIAAIVLGLPIHLSGKEGQKSTEVRHFADWLRTIVNVPVYFWDERFSSAEADELLSQRKLTNKKRKERRDSFAAVVILQGFIEADCPLDYQPRSIDD